MERIGSLNALVDYGGLGDSDIEDSDEETGDTVVAPARRIPVTKPNVKTAVSSRLVSYDDPEEETVSPKAKKERVEKTESADEHKEDEMSTQVETSELVDQPEVITQDPEEKPDGEPKQEPKTSKPIIELPPEPIGRCSNMLQDKIASLLQKKSRLNINESIQERKHFRNPSIYEKLIAFCNLDELGTNYPKSLYDPACWKEESFYESLAKAQVDAQKSTKRAQIEFVSGTKKATKPGEPESRKRKSKWDVPGNAVKTATPPKVGALVPGIGQNVGVGIKKP